MQSCAFVFTITLYLTQHSHCFTQINSNFKYNLKKSVMLPYIKTQKDSNEISNKLFIIILASSVLPAIAAGALVLYFIGI